MRCVNWAENARLVKRRGRWGGKSVWTECRYQLSAPTEEASEGVGGLVAEEGSLWRGRRDATCGVV
jgi:hypothetical protein